LPGLLTAEINLCCRGKPSQFKLIFVLNEKSGFRQIVFRGCYGLQATVIRPRMEDASPIPEACFRGSIFGCLFEAWKLEIWLEMLKKANKKGVEHIAQLLEISLVAGTGFEPVAFGL
jgi:hypothetical protein